MLEVDPQAGHSEQEARDYASGLSGVTGSVLDSSQFSSLRPGYWVVYAGRYGSMAEATSAADQLHAQGYPDAYARRVAP